MGTYRTLDRNIPFPFLLDKNKDSIFFIDHKNEVLDKTLADSPAYKTGDTIRMPQHSFNYLKHGFWIVSSNTKDSLAFPFRHEKFIANFKYAKETEDFDVEKVKKQLLQNRYEAEVISATPNSDLQLIKTWQFSNDSLQTVFLYYQDELVHAEQQIKKYHLFERSGKLFFSENELPENPQVLYQIIDFDTDSFTVQYYRNNEKILEDYKMTEKGNLPMEIPFYTRCLEGQAGQYYHDDITYKKGNEYLLRKISENAPLAQGNGYITVHFVLNCEGKLGRIGLEQMDRNYKATSFASGLVKHIISKVSQLKDWPEVKSGYAYKDVHAFLMFKIENGKITDLCP
ncbi:MAG TPA: hypothetical protein VFM82_05635 [Flavobacteriaceae bacterium]|nr:hypothetical protein [Flavobacteriaceae bacterium]